MEICEIKRNRDILQEHISKISNNHYLYITELDNVFSCENGILETINRILKIESITTYLFMKRKSNIQRFNDLDLENMDFFNYPKVVLYFIMKFINF